MRGAFSAPRAGGRGKSTTHQYKHNQAYSHSEENFSKHFPFPEIFFFFLKQEEEQSCPSEEIYSTD